MNPNPLPEHDDESYARLKADIEVNGILDPIEVDAVTGETLDGHTRERIADELRIKVRRRKITGLTTGAEREAYAIRRNLHRRSLTAQQTKVVRERQRELAADLAAQGLTQEQIGQHLGVSQGTISKWVSSIPSNNAHGQRRKLDEDDIEAIVKLLAGGETHTAIAKQFDVDRSRISQIAAEHEHEWRPLPFEVAGAVVRCGDARDHWPDDLADLAFFSPPYNVGIDYEGGDDRLDPDEWDGLIASTLGVLRDGWRCSRIVVNVPAALNRRPYIPVALPVVDGLDLEAVIVWDKGTTGNRTSWGSWRLPTAPALRDRTERLYVYRTVHELRGAHDSFELDDGRAVSPLLRPNQFTELTQDLWRISPESATAVGHPAPFPVALAESVIRLYGWPGCTVIDPFGGSGTTALAAVGLGCRAITNDQSETYARLALRRLLEATR